MVMVRDWSTRWTRTNSCRHTRLLAALAVMALAGFAQAASIDWKSQGYLWDVENNKKAETISGGGIYLWLVMTADDGTESYEFLTHGNVGTSGRTEDIGKVTGGFRTRFGVISRTATFSPCLSTMQSRRRIATSTMSTNPVR